MPVSGPTNYTRSGASAAPGVGYLIGYECWGNAGLSLSPVCVDLAAGPPRAVSLPAMEIILSPQHRRYLATETAISVVINVALSAVFTWTVFGGRAIIAADGAKGFGLDFLPQTFMISLMSVVVPTLLTRKRLSAGRLSSIETRRSPWPLWMRAPLIAVAATLVLGGSAALLSPMLAPQGLVFPTLFGVKLAYGAIIAMLVTPIGLVQALREPPRTPSL